MKMKIAELRECGIAKSKPKMLRKIPQFRILAIPHLLFVLAFVVLPVVAQTNKVTVTLVRWPYT